MAEGTTQARLEIARANEAIVRAEAALQGERVVTRVRLAMQVLRSLAIPVALAISGVDDRLGTARGVVVVGYLLYSLAAAIRMHRNRASVAGSVWGPRVFTLIDTTFVVLLAWFASQQQLPYVTELSAVTLALVTAFAGPRGKEQNAVFASVVCVLGYIACVLIVWHRGVQVALPLAVVVVVTLGAVGYLTRVVARQTGEMFLAVRKRDNLSRYLPRQVVDRVLSLDETALAPAKREVTILFSDLRDFTTTCERMDPREVLALLDDYFGHMSQIVKGHDGMVNKYIGDGMLAVWGALEPAQDHAVLAVKAALDMRKKLAEINDQRRSRGAFELRMGIGVHTGVAAVGGIGGAEQIEYTVLGDAVNLASRIEGLNKQHGTDILISDATWQRVRERISASRVGEEHVKGREEPVVVYALARAA